MIALVSLTHFLSLFAYFHEMITRASLLYLVRTWYILRHISSTTHPNQPTYTFNELQGKKKEEKNTTEHKQTKKNSNNHNNNNNHFISQIHYQYTNTYHFKTTFMCPRSIAGVPSSKALPGYLINAHRLCVFLLSR